MGLRKRLHKCINSRDTYNSRMELLLAMEVRTCCLCHNVTGDQKGKNKWKKLYGEPCAAERKRLSDFCCSLYNAPFESIFPDKTSVVCYMCVQKLAKLIKMETELSRLKGDITLYLETIWQTLVVSTVTPPQKRKQNGNDTYSGHTPTKVPRTTCHPRNVSVRILLFYYNVNHIIVLSDGYSDDILHISYYVIPKFLLVL